MSTDLSAFLAGLVADVNAEIEQVEADPLHALDEALDDLAEARAARKAWILDETNQARRGKPVLLGGNCRYNADNEASIIKATNEWDAGQRTADWGWQGKGPINPAIIEFGHEMIRLNRAVSDAEQAVETIRKSIDHADLPLGTMVSYATAVGNDAYPQVGFIQKATDSSYIVSLETWHPNHTDIGSDSGSARINRTTGIKRIGYSGGRSLAVLGSAEKGAETRARVSEMLAAKAAANAYERQVIDNHNTRRLAYESQVQAQTGWDNAYRNASQQSRSEAERQVLEKYAAEVSALTTAFTTRKREAMGTRPEVTAPKASHAYYFRDCATPEQTEELQRLQAVAFRAEKRVRG